MKLLLVDEKGDVIPLDEAEGGVTTVRMLKLFERCIELQRRKALVYGDAYRSQGYMGNVARVLSKVARLKNMVWTNVELSPPEETIEDTALDLINIATFFLINREDKNKWG